MKDYYEWSTIEENIGGNTSIQFNSRKIYGKLHSILEDKRINVAVIPALPGDSKDFNVRIIKALPGFNFYLRSVKIELRRGARVLRGCGFFHVF